MPHPVPSIPPPTWEGLLELARVLRGPGGCPWDREQTPGSLAGHLVEEAYEVLHAAEAGDRAGLTEELGDTAFLLAMVQAAAEDSGGAAFQEVAQRAVTKIVGRHPHVFRDQREMDPRAVALQWQEIKKEERAAAGDKSDDPPGTLAPPPPALPALLQAFRLQERAAAVGFDWPAPEPVLEKISEELEELSTAMKSPAEQKGAQVREEAGDLLFAVVNLIRLLDLDPELILREASVKFRNRFNRMAAVAAQEGKPLESLGLERLEQYWQAVKRMPEA